MLVNVQYPEAVINIREIKSCVAAGDKVGDVLERHLSELDNNITIKDAEISGIARRESILGIQPSDVASLEDRRLEVLLRWYDTPMYTEVTLRQKLDATLGAGQYDLVIDLDKKLVSCLVEITRSKMMESVREMFEQMIPLDYLISVTVRYNQYKKLKPYTYGQLKSKTYHQLRNEVIDIATDN